MKYFVAGHRGMVGSAILRRLQAQGGAVLTRTRAELDLTDQAAVRRFFQAQTPDAVILAAARVGGIHANATCPADFIHDNLMIQSNVIHQAFKAGVGRLLFLGSSCIYPRDAAQPMAEEALLTGRLEPANEPYALAKIAGIKMCESYNRQHGVDYRSVMPASLYGPNDDFHPENSHVLPALIRRFHEAVKTGADNVTVWGTGTPRREFLHVDDMARAGLFVLDLPKQTYRKATGPMLSHINVGAGRDISIRDLAALIARITGFGGRIAFDAARPDGAPRKLMNIARLTELGWQAEIPLAAGIKETCRRYLAEQADGANGADGR